MAAVDADILRLVLSRLAPFTRLREHPPGLQAGCPCGGREAVDAASAVGGPFRTVMESLHAALGMALPVRRHSSPCCVSSAAEAASVKLRLATAPVPP